MTDYTREIRKRLAEGGWRFHRQGRGDHEIELIRRLGEKVTLDGNVRNRALANKILKDARLGKKF